MSQWLPQPLRRAVPGSGDRSGTVPAALRILLTSGHLESAVMVARNAVTRGLPGNEIRTIQRLLADLRMTGGDPTAATLADHPDDWALPGSVDRPDWRLPEHRRAAAMALSGLEWSEGRVAEALLWGQEAAELTVTPQTAADGVYARLSLAAKLVALGEIPKAESLLEWAQQPASGGHAPVCRTAIRLEQANIHSCRGEVDAAQRLAEHAHATAGELGMASLSARACAILCRCALQMGDHAAAARHLKGCQEASRRTTSAPTVQAMWLEVLLLASQLRSDKACELLATTHAELPSIPTLHLEEPSAAAWFVRLSAAVGDPRPGQVALRTVEALALANPGLATIAAAAAHAHGLATGDAEELTSAAARHRQRWAREAAASDLRRLLTHKRAAVPGRPEPTVDLSVLNDTERVIATLVADGLTNQQVAREVQLSPHTVNYYLRRIYPKLGVRSRIELARLAHQFA